MNEQQLNEFRKTAYLKHGHKEVLDNIRPSFERLFDDLIALPERAEEDAKLAAISDCFDSINEFEEDIETVERETILEAIYAVGSIVGLDQDTEYAEQYRGDW